MSYKPHRNRALLALLLVSLTAGPQTEARPAPRPSRPLLLHVVNQEGRGADVLLVGTPERQVYLFRDPEGRRLRTERTGSLERGLSYTFAWVGSKETTVSIRAFPIFQSQGLQEPILVELNGRFVAGLQDEGDNTRKFSKQVHAEFLKLPSDFQAVVDNFRKFLINVEKIDWIAADAGMASLLVSEDWNLGPSQKSYEVKVVPVDSDDEVAGFQRSFAE